MHKGIQLSLLVGPAVPVPAPKVVLDALTSVEVTTDTKGPSGFQLRFELRNKSPLHTLFLLAGGASLPPIMRVIIVATVNGSPEVLMDGVMTNHEVSPGQSPGESLLSINGTDLTAVMDHVDFTGAQYPAMPPSARVALIVAKYAMFGIVPKVIPSLLVDMPDPLSRTPVHRGTDLCYIEQLAEEVGYRFYLDPGPMPGVSTAYWGPEIKAGRPQPALNIDMDAHTNVESLSFDYRSEKATLPFIVVWNEETHLPVVIPVPDVTPLNPPLAAIPPYPKNFPILSGSAKYGPIRAAMIGLAKSAASNDVVTATGELDVVRYGRVLKARRLVGVRGAGLAFNGLYYVNSVTHKIRRGEYKQSFTLKRNGLISSIPRVPA